MKRPGVKAKKRKSRTIGGTFPPGIVAVPCVDWVWTGFLKAFLALKTPSGTDAVFSDSRATIAAKRNHVVENLLKDPTFKWILYLDSDMTPLPDTLLRLLATQQDIVSGLCVQRKPPYLPCVGFDGPNGLGTTPLDRFGGPSPIVEVDWAGTGCLLVRRKVFERMEPAWFEAASDGEGSDIAFCRKARRSGFKIFCDTTQWVGHISARPITIEGSIIEKTGHPGGDALRASCRQPVKAPVPGFAVAMDGAAR